MDRIWEVRVSSNKWGIVTVIGANSENEALALASEADEKAVVWDVPNTEEYEVLVYDVVEVTDA